MNLSAKLASYKHAEILSAGSFGIVYTVSDDTASYALKVAPLKSYFQTLTFFREVLMARYACTIAASAPVIAPVCPLEFGLDFASARPSEVTSSRKRRRPEPVSINGYILYPLATEGTFEKYILTIMTVRDTASVILRVAQQLKVMHDHGMAHNDMKYNNVVIDENGKVKLIDFGLSCVSQDVFDDVESKWATVVAKTKLASPPAVFANASVQRIVTMTSHEVRDDILRCAPPTRSAYSLVILPPSERASTPASFAEFVRRFTTGGKRLGGRDQTFHIAVVNDTYGLAVMFVEVLVGVILDYIEDQQDYFEKAIMMLDEEYRDFLRRWLAIDVTSESGRSVYSMTLIEVIDTLTRLAAGQAPRSFIENLVARIG